MHKLGILGQLGTGGGSGTGDGRQLWLKYQSENMHKLDILRQFWTGGGSGTGDGRYLWIKYQSGNIYELMFWLPARGRLQLFLRPMRKIVKKR
ncbi:uncharacterized protein Hexim isoform X2 [Periplaneta americana]|uniref:uncharacterized protein Hexim isoform X2 n=1 Tax=Periplaneta americana TaxID=6978 RepID=UPI0037E93ED7